MGTATTAISQDVPTDGLLRWASELTIGQLPDAAVEAIRDDVVDGLGCGLFGSTLPATEMLRDVLTDQGSPSSGATLWGTGLNAAALDAVVVNAAALNGFELDGGNHLTRNVHGGMTVYPAVLAIAELTGQVTGADLVASAAAGWETSVRISRAMGPTVMDRGWYGTPIYATLGSAVAAGRALHLDPQQMQAAFELALLHASGLTVASEEGMGKPLSSGEAVRSGVLCALVARKGARGPRHSYGHPKGFAAAYSTPSERNDDELVIAPGDPLACQHISAKAYASCGAGHPVTDMLHDFAREVPSIGPETVEKVTVRLGVTTARHIGGPYVPSDVTNAQFNLSYCIAAQLLEGDNQIAQFRPELLSDPRISELVKLIEIVPDESVGSASTKLRKEAFVTLKLTDGRVLEGHRTDSRDPDREGIHTKFRGLASYALSEERASDLLLMMESFEKLDDVSDLARQMAT